MSGKEYTDTILMTSNSNGKSFALFNLDGKYDSFTFTIGRQDNTANADGVLNIYLDGELVQTENIKWDALAREITVPLNGALQMKLELASGATWFGFGDAYFE